MKKLQVTGDFMLVCPQTRIEFEPGVAVPVEEVSDFMQDRIDLGQLAYAGGDIKKEIEQAPQVLEEVIEDAVDEPPIAIAPAEPKPKPPVKRRKKARR